MKSRDSDDAATRVSARAGSSSTMTLGVEEGAVNPTDGPDPCEVGNKKKRGEKMYEKKKRNSFL